MTQADDDEGKHTRWRITCCDQRIYEGDDEDFAWMLYEHNRRDGHVTRVEKMNPEWELVTQWPAA